jgi:glycosyltransferase involved in cell wall biosynthesis
MISSVGVGVCTYKRPEELKKTLNAVLKYTPDLDIRDLVVADDGSPRWVYEHYLNWDFSPTPIPFLGEVDKNEGVCQNKNKILAHFHPNRDVIIIIEDDCRPIKEGWLDFYLNGIEKTGVPHFNYIEENDSTKTGVILGRIPFDSGEVVVTQHLMGCLMTFTHRSIEVLGGFDERLVGWGFTHVEYSERCYRSGLAPGFCHLKGNSEYIMWDSKVPSVLSEEEKKVCIERNRPIWTGSREEKDLYRSFHR